LLKRAVLVGWTVVAWVAAFTYLATAALVPQAPALGTTATIEVLGHFVATFVLAVLLAELFTTRWGLNIVRGVAAAALIAILLALSLEVLQLFRPGRSVQAIDVVFDIAGGVAGSGVYFVAARRWRRVASWSALAVGLLAVALTAVTVLVQPTVRQACRGETASQVDPQLLVSGDGIRVKDGLVVEYRFEERTGESTHSSRGTVAPFELALEPGATWVKGRPGVHVSGPAGRIRSIRPASGVVDTIMDAGSFTVEAWVMPDHEQGGPARILSISGGTNLNEIDVQIGQEATCLSHRIRFGDETEWVVVEGAFDDTTVRHVVLTFATGETSSFVNGELIDLHKALEAQPSTWNPAHHLLIGNEESGDRVFEGVMMLVAIYDRALTPGEILSNYQAGLMSPG
jgi:VanZ family protein